MKKVPVKTATDNARVFADKISFIEAKKKKSAVTASAK
jgi:hypothetical protein